MKNSASSLRLILAGSVAALLATQSLHAADATWGANSNSAWYTGTNWAGGAFPGLQGVAASNTDIATFTNAFTGTTPGINMGTASLNLGAVVIDSTRTTATNLGNSSATAGVLRLYGATVGGTANTILSNAGAGLFTLQATQTGTMGVVLSNTTDNIINASGTGGISISGIISQSVAGNKLTKTGAGTLTLSGANTFSGGLIIKAGTVSSVAATSMGTGAVTIGDSANTGLSATWASSAASNTYTNAISTTGTGTNSILVQGFNPIYQGAITLGSNLSVISNNTSGSTISSTGGISGTGNLTIQSNAANTASSAITFSGATLNFNGSITNSGTTTSTTLSNTTISSVIGPLVTSGGVSIIQNSTNSQLTLSGNNTYTGNVTVTAGQLNVSGVRTGAATSGALGNPTVNNPTTSAARQVTIASGATLNFSTNDVLGDGGSAPTLTIIANGGTIRNGFNGLNSLGPVQLNGGTLTSIATGTTGFKLTGTITVGGSAVSTISGTGVMGSISPITYNVADVVAGSDLNVSVVVGDLFGAGGINKTGAGTMTLSATNTFTGNTTISNGSLSIATTGALPGFTTNGRYSVANGATLAVYNAVTDANITSMLGTTNFAAGSALGFDTTTANRTYSVVLADTAQGALGLTKLGANTLTIDQANSFTGGTNVNAGTLSFSSGSLGTTGDITVNGGTLQWETGNTSDISSRLILVTAGTASLNTNNQTVAFANGTNNVTSTLTKTGTGNLTMNGNNLHDGLTTVTGGGSLTLAGDNTGMTGGVTLDGTTAGTRININSDTALGTGTFTISGAGNGSIANSSGVARTLSTNNAQTWGQNFAVVATNSLDMGTGAVNLVSASGTRVVTLSGSGIFTVGGVVSGGAGIQLGGTGTMALTNTGSTYTGATVIGNGSNDTFLKVTKLANLSQTSSLGAPTTATNGVITIGNSSQPGTLELVGGTTASSTDRQVRIGGNNNGAGNATIINNNTDPANSLIFTNPAFNLSNATTGSNRTLTLAGSNTGANEIQGVIINNNNLVGVTVTGSGSWRLSGNNTYSSVTTVAGTATLTLSGNNSGAAGGVTLSTATTVNPPRLNLNSATALGTGTLLFGGGAATDTVRLDNTSAGLITVTTNNVFSLNRDFTFIGTQSLNLGNMTTTLGGMTTGSSRNITVTANTLTFASAIGQGAANLGVNKLGAGTLVFNGANTYSGNTTISGGVLQLGNSSALGFGARQTTATGTTTVGSGFTLDLNGAATLNEPLILNGTGIGGNGALVNTNTVSTAIIGSGIAGIQQSAATNGSGYSSAPAITISGTGSGATAAATLGVTDLSFTAFNGGDKVYTVAPTVTISGGGGAGATATAVLSGGTSGTLIGFTITNAGSGFTSAPTVTFGNGTFSSGTINGSATGNATEFTVSGIIMTAAGSGYTGTPTYTIDSGNATAGSVSLSSVILATDSSIGGAGNITVNSVVSDSGAAKGLTKVGVGTVTLSGVNTYTGATAINAGTLLINGSISGSATTVNTSGILGGSGTVGDLTVNGGTLAPGNSPGILNAGNTTFSGGTAAYEIFGTTAGNLANNYDQLNVSGTVSFTANTALTINLGAFNPVDDVDKFTLINNDSTDTISLGGFGFTYLGDQLTEGEMFTTTEGQAFTITYAGGTDANDVIISAVPEPGSALMLAGGLATLLGFRRRRSA